MEKTYLRPVLPPDKTPRTVWYERKKKIQIVIKKARNLDEFPKYDMYANEYPWINREEKSMP